MKLHSRDIEGAEREFVWDVKESGLRYTKTIGAFIVFAEQNKAGTDRDTISIFADLNVSPVIRVPVQKAQFIDFFTQSNGELYSAVGNSANDSLTIKKLDRVTRTWNQVLKFDLRTLRAERHFDWTFRLLPSYFKITDQDIEEMRIYDYSNLDQHRSIKVMRLFNKTDQTFELQSDEIKRKIELSANGSR